ncbi:MAG TPA: homoserine dehydrogenase [Dongiaceae bacterium]|nr:homoserine dehydrogenase [Dongiaceae bacterium]
MNQPLRVGLAGLGTVGAGTASLLASNGEIVAQHAGRPVEVIAVAARDRGKERGYDVSALRWLDDARLLARDPEVDVVVEAIGGAEGIAREVVETALDAGKHVVTANKALLAHHGAELARKAERNNRALAYEAAVAGGIPVIKAMREGLAANRITSVYGILNGTSNYILTEMRRSGREFAEVLKEAQRLGYAEADPSFDVDGIDAAHKLTLLASVAFGGIIPFEEVKVTGIRQVSALDIGFAEELGYRIRLIGIAHSSPQGVRARVHACLVPGESLIGKVEGVYNAVVTKGNFVGQNVSLGRGAGAGPTASAIVADLIDIARGHILPVFSAPAHRLKPVRMMEDYRGSYYLRLMVVDKPGVVADIAASLRDENVSMEQMIQRGRAPGEPVPIVITTHETSESAIERASRRLATIATIVEPPHIMVIESLE